FPWRALDVGLGRFVPLLLVPAAPQDPGAGLRLLGRRGYHGHDLVPRPGAAEVQVHLGLAKAQEMSVPFDEARDSQMAAQIDHLRPRAGLLRDLPVRPEGGNPSGSDGNCLSLRARRIESDDLAV